MDKKNFVVLTFVRKKSRIFAVVKIELAIQLFEQYAKTERRLANGTVRYYIAVPKQFSEFLFSQQITDLEQITSQEVRQYQMLLMQNGTAPSTVTKQLAALRVWFKFLRRQKLLGRDIMAPIAPPKAPKRLPIAFRENEAEKIYADIFPNTYDGELDKLVLRLLYETGMRRTELASLTLADIDLSGLCIKVLGKRNKERIIPIEPELAAHIGRFISMRNDMLATLEEQQTQDKGQRATSNERLLVNSHGRPVSDNMVYRIVERYMSVYSNAERTSPHIFRHTFATHILNEGANIDAIKELLGHSSLNATEIYTHVSRQHLKETYQHAHPRALKK